MKALIHEAILIICEKDEALSNRLQLICQLKGGWEGWLQAELFVQVFELSEQTIIPLREMHIYNNKKQACDFFVEPDDNHGGCIVELKALGLARNVPGFLQGIEDDLIKLKTDNIRDEFNDLMRLSVAVIPGFLPDVKYASFHRPLMDLGYGQIGRNKSFNIYGKDVKD